MNFFLLFFLSATCCTIIPLQESYSNEGTICNADDNCTWQISSSYTGTNRNAGTARNITAALGYACSYYFFQLLDAEHNEFLFLSNFSTILIKGRNTSEGQLARTVWRIKVWEGALIFYSQGDMTIANISFQYNIINHEGTPTVVPWGFMISLTGSTTYRRSLTLQYCEIHGQALNSEQIQFAINTNKPEKVNIISCAFYKLNVKQQDRGISFVNCPLLVIKDSNFTDLLGQEYSGGIDIIDNGISLTINIEISGCTFQRCFTSSIDAGAIYINISQSTVEASIAINNCTFNSNKGGNSGAILLIFNSINSLQIYNNIFLNNEITEVNGAQDVFILKTTNDLGWSASQAQNFFKVALEGSMSTENKSVKYQVFGYDANTITLNQFIIPDFEIKYIKNPNGEGEEQFITSVLGDESTITQIEIILVGSSHTEQVIINSSQGGNRNRITITGDGERLGKYVTLSGGSEIEGKDKFIITVTNEAKGDTLIRKIEMVEWKGGFIKIDGGNTIALHEIRFVGGGSIIHNIDKNLEVSQCDFKGDSQNTEIESFIIVTNGIIEIFNSTFQQGSFVGIDKGCIICNGSNTQCLIDGCEFTQNKIGSQSAAVQVVSSSCTLLQINGSANKRTIFSGKGNSSPHDGEGLNAAGFTAEIEEGSYVQFIECIFQSCIDLTEGNLISSGAICIFSKSSSMKSKAESNIGEVSITKCKFADCAGKNSGGIFFGENIIPASSQYNIFMNNRLTSQTGSGAADIFFSSKELLDEAGGIEFVCEGVKYESEAIGKIKIEGFSANFAPYLNCKSREVSSNCDDIPCGGTIGMNPEDCPWIDEVELEIPKEVPGDKEDIDEVEKETKKMKDFPVGIIVGIAVGVLAIVVIVVVVIAIIITKKKKTAKSNNKFDPNMLAQNLPMEIQYSHKSSTLDEMNKIMESNNW
ncbi:MAG: hypothetical protein EZS28_008576 [Streblomastix strix]|uniref:Right handed beta helix domain-containing protein n=1 Tax=Streblomastix strix TaxID=222440 RepID=A0A5J4WLF4_9EUKA|nr:MAG: hypothetical protein EZS28_008576 [Streblomastix strix]